LVRAATDLPVDVAGNGENVRLQQNLLNKGDVNWGFEVAA
jgi:hypothetical protein